VAIKSTVIVSDLQAPYHSVGATNALAKFIQWYQPAKVACVGDEIDLPQISRWEEGRGGEHTGDLGKHRDIAVALIRRLGITDISRSNHTDRLYNKLASKAPGFLGLPELSLENFMKAKELGVTYHKKPFELAPGWLLLHGDESGVQPTGGLTALGLAKRSGYSVTCGHTHRMGLSHYTTGINGKCKVIYGMEVGNLMDYNHAKYIKGGLFTWNQGFGILHVDGNTVHPQLVPIVNNSFTVNGKVWKW
jgi:hypothetical protein